MPRGYLALVLHAHLPFVRHPEHAEFLEERWLFEAVSDCYLPLLGVFEKLADDGVPFRATLSISPTLAAMLDDDLLRRRCHDFLKERQAKSQGAAPFLAEHSDHALREFERRGGDIVGGFSSLQQRGCLEIITTAATHGFLPLQKSHAPTVRAQIRVALDEHVRRFHAKPCGFWLPECGFYPGLQHELAAAGVGYFIVDAHGFLNAQPPAPHGVFAPVACPGVAVFARDPDSAREVWGPGGFPGAAAYRDFHATDGNGFKSFAVTGAADEKKGYDPKLAARLALHHAHQFVQSRIAQAEFQAAHLANPPVIVAAYDAELFGHWWHEGPQFLEHVLRIAASHGKEIETITPSDYIARHPPAFAAVPGASSWGQHGFNDYWLNATNHWIYPELRRAALRFAEVCTMHGGGLWEKPRAPAPNGGGGPLLRRAHQQAGRSLLLAQASDWPFMMKRGASASYAGKRLSDQLARVHHLCDAIEQGTVSERRLLALEQMDNLFPHLDCRHFLEA